MKILGITIIPSKKFNLYLSQINRIEYREWVRYWEERARKAKIPRRKYWNMLYKTEARQHPYYNRDV